MDDTIFVVTMKIDEVSNEPESDVDESESDI